MGVSGSGKTEIGQRLAVTLGGEFFDADNFHPPANVAKMSSGQPLNDDDRWPWLQRLREEIIESCPEGATRVLACSALKRRYRDFLRATRPEAVQLVYLEGDYDTIYSRMAARRHFMRESMLRSQFETLEPPDDVEKPVRVSIVSSPDEIVAEITQKLP